MTLPIHSPVARAMVIATAMLGAAMAGGCKPKASNDATTNQVATPITLPPAISRSATYRCKDNSLIYVDYFTDGVSANLRTTQDGPIHHLAASTNDQPLAGDGYTLSRGDKTVQFTAPAGAAQTCKS